MTEPATFRQCDAIRAIVYRKRNASRNDFIPDRDVIAFVNDYLKLDLKGGDSLRRQLTKEEASAIITKLDS